MKLFLKNVWSIIAALCLLAAAVLWFYEQMDAIFVVATLGVLAWFMNLRGEFSIKKAHAEREAAARAEREEETSGSAV